MGRCRICLIAGGVTAVICALLLLVALLVANTLPEDDLQMSMSDMIPIDKISSAWCKEVEVTSDKNVNTFLLKSSTPRISPDERKQYDLDFSLRFFSVYSRVLHYFLLPGSRVNISACAREPGVFLYLFKNREDMRRCLRKQHVPDFWINDDEDGDIHGKFKKYVQDRIKERLDNVHDRLDRMGDKVVDGLQDGLNHIRDRVKDRMGDNKEQFNERMDRVHDRLEYVRERLRDKIDNDQQVVTGLRDRLNDTRERIDKLHDKVHGRIEDSLNRLDNRRERIRDRLDNVEDRVNDRLDIVRERINNRLDNSSDGLDEARQRVKDRLDHVKERLKERLDDAREKLDRLKPFQRDCSSALTTVEVPVVSDGERCSSSNNSVSVNITDTGNYFIVLENFYYYGINKVNLRVRLDRAVYDLPDDSKVCSNTKKCTVPLLFRSQQKPVVQMETPSGGQQDDDVGGTAKVVTVCKARVSFFFLLFAAVPVVILIGIGVCIGILCTWTGKARMYTYIQKMDTEEGSRVPLLKQHNVSYCNGTSTHNIPRDDFPPPPYTTAPPDIHKSKH